MFSLANQVLAIFWVALRRLRSQRGLALATMIGLLIAIALTMSIPLYADATLFRLLRENLYQTLPPGARTPLVFYFIFHGSSRNSPQWPDSRPFDDYMSRAGPASLRLPELSVVRNARTDGFKLFPPSDPQQPQTQYMVDWVNISYFEPLEDQINLVEGAFPSPADAQSEFVPVLVNAEFAFQYAVSPGDVYYLRRDNGLEIPVKIAGLWEAHDPDNPLFEVGSDKWLVVPEATFAERIAPLINDDWSDASWYWQLDGSGLHARDIARLLEGLQADLVQIGTFQPGIKLELSPVKELQSYQEAAPILTLLLYAFSIPIIGLTLAFIGLVTGMFVAQHQNEIAVMRSRGASAMEMVGMTVVEGAVLGGLAILLGIPAGELAARLIGRARSFLDFSSIPLPRVTLTSETLVFGLAAAGFVLLVQILLPAFSAAQRTIVTYKQERARSIRSPWWQRYWLDLAAFIPAGYAIFLLTQQGSIAAEHGAANSDPFQNPILLLAPALTILAATLVVIRLLPAIISFIAWLAARTNSVGFLMASRYLSRSPATYNTPLILLVLTLSLSAFTASLAGTLDQHLQRQTYYQVGADLSITELGILPPETVSAPAQRSPWEGTSNTPRSVTSSRTSYLFDPVDDHLRLPGVMAASRVGSHMAAFVLADGSQEKGFYIGIDRFSFPEVAFWQDDFASQGLGDLMNALAAEPDGVLVPQDYLEKRNLSVGDMLAVNVQTGGALRLEFEIVGTFVLFPTWYPEQGPLVVGNLDYLYSQAGGELPHQVWLKTAPGVIPGDIVAAVRGYTAMLDLAFKDQPVVENGLNTFVKDWNSATQLIVAEQRRPERQGLFGLLSVGFITSALLTVLGFLLYAIFSFRRRFIELGMLRAIGLSAGQMTALLASELAFLLGIGLAVGTFFGVVSSRLFIPFLQVGAELAERFPPFVVRIAWSAIFEMYLLFIFLFIAALGALVGLLLRMKIFQAVKLGETV